MTEFKFEVCALHCAVYVHLAQAMPLLAEWMMLPKMTALIALLYMLLCLPKIYTCLTIVSNIQEEWVPGTATGTMKHEYKFKIYFACVHMWYLSVPTYLPTYYVHHRHHLFFSGS